VTPSNGQALTAAEDLPAGTRGLGMGDRHCWAPRLREPLSVRGVHLLAPFRWRKHAPWPRLRRDLFRWRYRIDTHFGHLVERAAIKRVWTHDLWHLTSRLLRTVLMPTLAVLTNISLERPPWHLAALAA
jgi:hypothetical protein